MASKMKLCPWKQISDFDGWSEFERFEDWLNEQIAEGFAKETSVLKLYSEVSCLKEKWFIHIPSAQVWRLVWPEPPFAGVFERLRQNG